MYVNSKGGPGDGEKSLFRYRIFVDIRTRAPKTFIQVYNVADTSKNCQPDCTRTIKTQFSRRTYQRGPWASAYRCGEEDDFVRKNMYPYTWLYFPLLARTDDRVFVTLFRSLGTYTAQRRTPEPSSYFIWTYERGHVYIHIYTFIYKRDGTLVANYGQAKIFPVRRRKLYFYARYIFMIHRM
jgi:hypothetical protein